MFVKSLSYCPQKLVLYTQYLAAGQLPSTSFVVRAQAAMQPLRLICYGSVPLIGSMTAGAFMDAMLAIFLDFGATLVALGLLLFTLFRSVKKSLGLKSFIYEQPFTFNFFTQT